MRPRKRPSRLAKTCVALGLLTVGLTNAVAVGQAAALPDEPVRLMMIYDRDTDDHYFGVTITLPAGRPHTICESGTRNPAVAVSRGTSSSIRR